MNDEMMQAILNAKSATPSINADRSVPIESQILENHEIEEDSSPTTPKKRKIGLFSGILAKFQCSIDKGFKSMDR
jgi:hypothetical protein